MILEIGIGIATALTVKNIYKNVRANHKLTKGLNMKDQRTLLWRYGPFTMDEYVVEQVRQSYLKQNEKEFSIREDMKRIA